MLINGNKCGRDSVTFSVTFGPLRESTPDTDSSSSARRTSPGDMVKTEETEETREGRRQGDESTAAGHSGKHSRRRALQPRLLSPQHSVLKAGSGDKSRPQLNNQEEGRKQSRNKRKGCEERKQTREDKETGLKGEFEKVLKQQIIIVIFFFTLKYTEVIVNPHRSYTRLYIIHNVTESHGGPSTGRPTSFLRVLHVLLQPWH